MTASVPGVPGNPITGEAFGPFSPYGQPVSSPLFDFTPSKIYGGLPRSTGPWNEMGGYYGGNPYTEPPEGSQYANPIFTFGLQPFPIGPGAGGGGGGDWFDRDDYSGPIDAPYSTTDGGSPTPDNTGGPGNEDPGWDGYGDPPPVDDGGVWPGYGDGEDPTDTYIPPNIPDYGGGGGGTVPPSVGPIPPGDDQAPIHSQDSVGGDPLQGIANPLVEDGSYYAPNTVPISELPSNYTNTYYPEVGGDFTQLRDNPAYSTPGTSAAQVPTNEQGQVYSPIFGWYTPQAPINTTY